MDAPCPVFVFDFDGVLAYKGGDRDVAPRMLGVTLVREALQAGGGVYIVTGRRRDDRSVVLGLLREAGIRPRSLTGVFFRERGSEVEYKLRVIDEIRSLEGCVGEVHDDNPEVLYPARRRVVHGVILHFNESCEVLEGYSVLPSCRSL